MIKGCEKRIIHVKNTNSPYFEEAYFILKSDSACEASEGDMIKAAERIAAEAAFQKNEKRRARLSKRGAILLLGFSVAFLAAAAVMLFCAILA